MKRKLKLIPIVLAVLLGVSGALGQGPPQTTAFTFQGKLSDMGSPANGGYQLQFKMFDAVTGGSQIGSTIADVSIIAAQGVFTTQLDFGANAFPGANRFLEIAVRRNSGESYVVLDPRQQVLSSPYAVKSKSADTAANASSLGGVAASEYVTTSSVGNSFVKNDTTLQTANFNISGNGVVGGNLGIGTTNPIDRLEVAGGVWSRNSISTHFVANTTGGTNAWARFYMRSPSQSWLIGTSENFNGNQFYLVDETNGATRMSIQPSFGAIAFPFGNVGIGTNNPLNPLHVAANVTGSAVNVENLSGKSATFSGGIVVNNLNGHGASFFNADVSILGNLSIGSGFFPRNLSVSGTGFFNTLNAAFPGGGTQTLCRNSGGFIAFCSSSLRYKTDVDLFADGMSIVNRLQPITFTWKDSKVKDLGLAAEDVERIEPLLVVYNPRGEIEGVKYTQLSAVFINALKQHQQLITDQKDKIEHLQRQLGTQREEIEKQRRLIEALTRIVCRQARSENACEENK